MFRDFRREQGNEKGYHVSREYPYTVQLTYILTSCSWMRTGRSAFYKSESPNSFGSVAYKSLRIRKSDFHYETNLRGTGTFRQKCLTCALPPLPLLCLPSASYLGKFLGRNSRTIMLKVCFMRIRSCGQKVVGLLTGGAWLEDDWRGKVQRLDAEWSPLLGGSCIFTGYRNQTRPHRMRDLVDALLKLPLREPL